MTYLMCHFNDANKVLLKRDSSGNNGINDISAPLQRSERDLCGILAGYGMGISDSGAGKCIPITRGGGIYQENMNEALDILTKGDWLHTFPEGKICQESVPIRRLKWGTASLIARAPVTPLVLPIVHCGFEKVMPEKYKFDRRPLFPLINKNIKIIVGEPLEFDVQSLRQKAKTMPYESSSGSLGWPNNSPDGLNVGAQRWLYANISDQIRNVMEKLRCFGMAAKNLHV